MSVNVLNTTNHMQYNDGTNTATATAMTKTITTTATNNDLYVLKCNDFSTSLQPSSSSSSSPPPPQLPSTVTTATIKDNVSTSTNGSKIEITVNNIVSSYSTRCHLNLRRIAMEGLHVEFKKENNMINMKLRNPLTTATMWSSGKITCAGAKSESDSYKAARRYCRLLQKLGYRVKLCNYRIVNVLATCTMPFEVDINKLANSHPQNCSYEPELHPGATYKLKDVKATMKIFTTGSVTFTAPCIDNIHKALSQIYPILLEHKKIIIDNKVQKTEINTPIPAIQHQHHQQSQHLYQQQQSSQQVTINQNILAQHNHIQQQKQQQHQQQQTNKNYSNTKYYNTITSTTIQTPTQQPVIASNTTPSYYNNSNNYSYNYNTNSIYSNTSQQTQLQQQQQQQQQINHQYFNNYHHYQPAVATQHQQQQHYGHTAAMPAISNAQTFLTNYSFHNQTNNFICTLANAAAAVSTTNLQASNQNTNKYRPCLLSDDPIDDEFLP